MARTSPDAHTLRQWTVHVRRMVRQGATADEVLRAMAEANWDEDEARRLLRRTVTRQRREALGIMVGFAVLAGVALVVTIGTYQAALSHGGEYYVWYGGVICGAVGFFYGLARLVKIRA